MASSGARYRGNSRGSVCSGRRDIVEVFEFMTANQTTFRDERVHPAYERIDRNFYADAPDVLWVADITYVSTWAGFLYLAVVLDAFSRRIVGWAMGNNLKTQLVLGALNMAVVQRKPTNVIHHSDQGS